MKIKLSLLLAMCLGSVLNAAVIHVSGTAAGHNISTEFGNSAECSASFDSVTLGGTACIESRSLYYSTAGASGDRFSGSVDVQAITDRLALYDDQGDPIDHLYGYSSAAADLSFSHTFYLSGGLGQAVLDLEDTFLWGSSDGIPSALCQIDINGQSYFGCGGTFAVSFFTPIHLIMDLHALAEGCCGDINFSHLSYDLGRIKVTQNGDPVQGAALQPVPEPASVLSVAAGLAVLGLRRRRR